MDREPEYSLSLARTDSPWDELDIGCNWFNAGIVLRAAVGTRRAPKFTDAKALEPGS